MTAFFNDILPHTWMLIILGSGTVFTTLWGLDAITHKELVKIDITDKELQTHRNILATSFLMEASLVLVYWFGAAMLPFFIAFFITRTVHEFIDEIHFHTDRCSPYESYLHLGMWVTVITKTGAMVIWGFVFGYAGILDLPIIYYIWGGILFSVMGYISLVEWRR